MVRIESAIKKSWWAKIHVIFENQEGGKISHLHEKFADLEEKRLEIIGSQDKDFTEWLKAKNFEGRRSRFSFSFPGQHLS